MELLSNREENEAYLSAKPGEQYVLFFTDGGSVNLDMTGHRGDFQLKWIDISTGEWAGEAKQCGGGATAVNAPAKGPWVAVIVRVSGAGGHRDRLPTGHWAGRDVARAVSRGDCGRDLG